MTLKNIMQSASLSPSSGSYFENINIRDVGTTALKVAKKVGEVAISAVLFLSNSSIFVIGFVIGIIHRAPMNQYIERIQNIWNTTSIWMKAAIIAAGVFAWPIALAVTAFFVGARCAVAIQEDDTAAEQSRPVSPVPLAVPLNPGPPSPSPSPPPLLTAALSVSPLPRRPVSPGSSPEL